MKTIEYEGKIGVFIPLSTWDEGRFFDKEEYTELQLKILALKKLVHELQEDVRRHE